MLGQRKRSEEENGHQINRKEEILNSGARISGTRTKMQQPVVNFPLVL